MIKSDHLSSIPAKLIRAVHYIHSETAEWQIAKGNKTGSQMEGKIRKMRGEKRKKGNAANIDRRK